MNYSFQQYITPDGGVETENTYHIDVTSYLVDQCQFCGCGLPEAALTYVYKVLRYQHSLQRLHAKFEDKNLFHNPAWDKCYRAWAKAGRKIMPDTGIEFFTRYWLDKMDLTEHGGSVSSAWLTPKGLALLNDLSVWYEEQQKLK